MYLFYGVFTLTGFFVWKRRNVVPEPNIEAVGA